jgi:acetylornithine deacetylase/succinyl-diaminopimelate desuccinylase-like protein
VDVTGRPGAIGTGRVPADGGDHPNKYHAEVTAHVRLYWPPNATDEQIDEALELAVDEVLIAYAKRVTR